MENGIVVDDEMHRGLREIMCTETSEVYRKYKPNIFHHLFWKQQMDAASHQDATGICWHPAMIRWCLHLRHRSSGAYKELRGVLKLPSQRTLRDYMHYVKAATDFSTEVNQMLVHAAKTGSCPEREMYVILLNAHTRISYIRQTYRRIRDVNEHLLAIRAFPVRQHIVSSTNSSNNDGVHGSRVVF